MFLDNSRYAKVAQDDLPAQNGTRKAIRLRRLSAIQGESYTVKDNDQLDILAHQRYGDATRFWHIADANTALQTTALLDETGQIILLPKS